MPGTHALFDALPFRIGVRVDAILEKGELIPADDIDSWITMPAGEEGGGRRFPIKYRHLGPGRAVAQVHPDFHPGLPEKWREGKLVPPTDAEKAEHAESLEKLKAREIVIDGEALQKHKEILASIAGQGDVHSAAAGRAQDALEKLKATDVVAEEKKKRATRKKTAETVVDPGEEQTVPTKRYNAQELILSIDDRRDETGGHANRRDKMGWDSTDKGLGERLATQPQEIWTASDWQAAKYLLTKYGKQHGVKLEQIDGLDKIEGSGQRNMKALSLVGNDIVVDTPYDEYHHRVVDDSLGTRYAGREHGKGKRAVSVDRFLQRLHRDTDPAEALQRFADQHGYAVDPALTERLSGPKRESVKARVDAKPVITTPWDDQRVGFGRDPGLTWKEVAERNPGFLDWMVDRFPKGDSRRDKAEDARDAHVRGVEPSSAAYTAKQTPVDAVKPSLKELETPWDNIKIGGGSKNADYTWGDLWKEKPRSIEFYATDPAMQNKAPGMVEIARAMLAAKRDGVENATTREWRERKERVEREEAERAHARNSMESAKGDATVHMPSEFAGGLFDPTLGHIDPTTYERDPETGAVIPGTAKQAGMRPYQAQAVNYMVASKRCGDFDEMGLGKTVSAITAGLLLQHSGETDGSAIMFPPSLLKNWQDELAKFAPGARVLAWAGDAAQRRSVYDRAKRDGFDFLLVPSSMIIQKEDGPLLGELCGGERIAKFVDEAHELKGGSANIKAKMTMDEALFVQNAPDTILFRGEAAVPGLTKDVQKKMYREDKIRRQWVLTDTWRKYKAQMADGGQDALEELTSGVVKGKKFGAVKQFFNKGHFKLLTATPVPNDPREAYRLMQLVDPAALGDRRKFEDRYLIKKVVNGHELVAGAKNLDELHERMKPYFIMRKLADPEVGIHLPPLITVKPRLSISKEQRPYYRAAVRDAIDAIEGASEEETATALERLSGTDDTIDLDAEAGKVDTSDKKQRKNILTALLRLRQVGISPELVDRNYAGAAPKVQAVAQAIRDRLKSNPGQGIAVFCEFNGAFPILQRELMNADEEGNAGLEEHHFGMITGDTPQKKRNQIQDDFNAGKLPVTLINVKAGGLGLNLQKSSSTVVHMSSHWNPKVEDQATARVYRPGQLHKTLMVKPLMDDPMDTHIEELHARKRATEDAILKGRKDQPREVDLDAAEVKTLLPRLKEFHEMLMRSKE